MAGAAAAALADLAAADVVAASPYEREDGCRVVSVAQVAVKQWYRRSYAVYLVYTTRAGAQPCMALQRYSAFRHLSSLLRKAFPDLEFPELPPKLLWHSPAALQQRCVQLNTWLQRVFDLPGVRDHVILASFLDPVAYVSATSFHFSSAAALLVTKSASLRMHSAGMARLSLRDGSVQPDAGQEEQGQQADGEAAAQAHAAQQVVQEQEDQAGPPMQEPAVAQQVLEEISAATGNEDDVLDAGIDDGAGSEGGAAVADNIATGAGGDDAPAGGGGDDTGGDDAPAAAAPADPDVVQQLPVPPGLEPPAPGGVLAGFNPPWMWGVPQQADPAAAAAAAAGNTADVAADDTTPDLVAEEDAELPEVTTSRYVAHASVLSATRLAHVLDVAAQRSELADMTAVPSLCALASVVLYRRRRSHLRGATAAPLLRQHGELLQRTHAVHAGRGQQTLITLRHVTTQAPPVDGVSVASYYPTSMWHERSSIVGLVEPVPFISTEAPETPVFLLTMTLIGRQRDASAFNKVAVVDGLSGRIVSEYYPQFSSYQTKCLSTYNNQRLFATGHERGRVHVVDTDTCRLLHDLSMPCAMVMERLRSSPHHLMLGYGDYIKLVDLETGQTVGRVNKPVPRTIGLSSIYSTSTQLDNSLLMTTDSGNPLVTPATAGVSLWDVRASTQRAVQVLRQHPLTGMAVPHPVDAARCVMAYNAMQSRSNVLPGTEMAVFDTSDTLLRKLPIPSPNLDADFAAMPTSTGRPMLLGASSIRYATQVPGLPYVVVETAQRGIGVYSLASRTGFELASLVPGSVSALDSAVVPAYHGFQLSMYLSSRNSRTRDELGVEADPCLRYLHMRAPSASRQTVSIYD